MTRIRISRRLPVTLLTLALVAGGAPEMACAGMLDCPMATPSGDCPETHGGKTSCAPLEVQADEDCCAVVVPAPFPIPALPSEVSGAAPASSVATAAASAGSSAALPVAGPPILREKPRPHRAVGRDLLSLVQTLLI